MKIEIDKSDCQAIDLFTKNQLILQVEKEGIYRYFIYQRNGDIIGLSVDQNYQIEEERDA